MSDATVAGIVGAIAGAIVGGLISFLISLPQLRLLRVQTAATIRQPDVPFLQHALIAASPVFLRRYVSDPPDRETLWELTDAWNLASEALMMTLPNHRGNDINSAIHEYINVLVKARNGEIASDAVEKARVATLDRINTLVRKS
jgi:hypothetical protein